MFYYYRYIAEKVNLRMKNDRWNITGQFFFLIGWSIYLALWAKTCYSGAWSSLAMPFLVTESSFLSTAGARYILEKDISPRVKAVTLKKMPSGVLQVLFNKWVNIHVCNFIINTVVAGDYAGSSECECAVRMF